MILFIYFFKENASRYVEDTTTYIHTRKHFYAYYVKKRHKRYAMVLSKYEWY